MHNTAPYTVHLSPQPTAEKALAMMIEKAWEVCHHFFPADAFEEQKNMMTFLHTIFRELLGNSYDSYHTAQIDPAQWQIAISAQRNPATQQIQITVADQGPGFSQTALEVFSSEEKRNEHAEYSERDVSHSRLTGGLGLGLLSLYHMIEERHGTIHIANHTPQGAIVTIVIPWTIGN